MANTRIGGYLFDVNPSSVKWSYSLRSRSIETYGGRVVQILGVTLGDITLTGKVLQGNGGQFEAMERFEAAIKDIMDRQVATRRSVRFEMPAVGLDGYVFIKGYKDVSYNYQNNCASYTLTLTVDTGFSGVVANIKSESLRSALDSVTNGVSWVRSVYNTPTTTGWDIAIEAMRNVVNNAELSGDYNYADVLTAILEARSGVSSESKYGSFIGAKAEEIRNDISAETRDDYFLLQELISEGLYAEDMQFSSFLFEYIQRVPSAKSSVGDVTAVYKYGDKYTLVTPNGEDVKYATLDDNLYSMVLSLWGTYQRMTPSTSSSANVLSRFGNV